MAPRLFGFGQKKLSVPGEAPEFVVTEKFKIDKQGFSKLHMKSGGDKIIDDDTGIQLKVDGLEVTDLKYFEDVKKLKNKFLFKGSRVLSLQTSEGMTVLVSESEKTKSLTDMDGNIITDFIIPDSPIKIGDGELLVGVRYEDVDNKLINAETGKRIGLKIGSGRKVFAECPVSLESEFPNNIDRFHSDLGVIRLGIKKESLPFNLKELIKTVGDSYLEKIDVCVNKDTLEILRIDSIPVTKIEKTSKNKDTAIFHTLDGLEAEYSIN